jgi:hypothetical protein
MQTEYREGKCLRNNNLYVRPFGIDSTDGSAATLKEGGSVSGLGAMIALLELNDEAGLH